MKLNHMGVINDRATRIPNSKFLDFQSLRAMRLPRLEKINIVTVLLGGVVAGGLLPFVLMAMDIETLSMLFTWRYLKSYLLFGLFGIIASVTFWFIAVKEYEGPEKKRLSKALM